MSTLIRSFTHSLTHNKHHSLDNSSSYINAKQTHDQREKEGVCVCVCVCVRERERERASVFESGR